jgi:hypothetical protein
MSCHEVVIGYAILQMMLFPHAVKTHSAYAWKAVSSALMLYLALVSASSACADSIWWKRASLAH